MEYIVFNEGREPPITPCPHTKMPVLAHLELPELPSTFAQVAPEVDYEVVGQDDELKHILAFANIDDARVYVAEFIGAPLCPETIEELDAYLDV